MKFSNNQSHSDSIEHVDGTMFPNFFEKAVYSVKEMAELLEVSPKHVYRLVEREEIPHKKIGSKIKFYAPVIDKWLME